MAKTPPPASPSDVLNSAAARERVHHVKPGQFGVAGPVITVGTREALPAAVADRLAHEREHIRLLTYHALNSYFHGKLKAVALLTTIDHEVTVRQARFQALERQRPRNFDSTEEKTLAVTETSFEAADALWHTERSFLSYLKDRLEEKPHSPDQPSIVERARRLTEYAERYGEDGIEDFARTLFPEWTFGEKVRARLHVELPTTAPETYQGLRGPEAPPQFVQRVYGEWLGKGLTRAHLRSLDPALYTAIHNWLKKPGCDWPSDIDLPTKSQEVDRQVDRLNAGASMGEFTLREMQRMSSAIQRRRGQPQK